MILIMIKKLFKNKSGIIFGLTLVLASLFGASTVYAASVSFSPATANVSVGNIVTIKALVNTGGKSVNNADSIIRFPTDLLEVVSVSKNSSIFSLWVEEPKFSNTAGTITFNGGVPNPGFNGPAGEMVSIVFKGKKAGSATVAFSDSAVRENNGMGTDILSGKQSATVVIGGSLPIEVPITPVTSGVPAKPVVTSSTHPNSESWYTNTSASFSWVIPSGVSSIQTLLSKNANETPTLTYDSSVSRRTVNDIGNGTFYFHIRYMNNIGWSPIAHFKVQIDSVAPEKFSPTVRIEDGRNVVTLNATDVTSGIDAYSIQVDNNAPFRVKASSISGGEYTLPVQDSGEHRLNVVAYDKANNHTEALSTFTSPEILAPTISVSPKEVERGESITISGKSSYSHTPVEIFTQIGNKKVKVYTATTDENGGFSVITEKLNASGAMRISAQLVFSENTKSPTSDIVSININDSYAVQTSKSVIYTLAFVIPTVLLIIGLIFAVYIGWHKFFGLRRKLRAELEDTIQDTHKAFSVFKDELTKQLDKLEKIKEDRELNRKEEKIFKELQSNIDDIDEFIKKRLKKIT